MSCPGDVASKAYVDAKYSEIMQALKQYIPQSEKQEIINASVSKAESQIKPPIMAFIGTETGKLNNTIKTVEALASLALFIAEKALNLAEKVAEGIANLIKDLFALRGIVGRVIELEKRVAFLQQQFNNLLINFNSLKLTAIHLQQDLVSLTNLLTALQQQFYNLLMQFNSLRLTVIHLQQDLASLTNKYNELVTKFNNIIAEFNRKIAAIYNELSSKLYRSEFSAFKTEIEQLLDTLGLTLRALMQSILDIKIDVGWLTKEVTNVWGLIREIQAKLNNAINMFISRIIGLEAKVTGLESKVTGLDAALKGLIAELLRNNFFNVIEELRRKISDLQQRKTENSYTRILGEKIKIVGRDVNQAQWDILTNTNDINSFEISQKIQDNRIQAISQQQQVTDNKIQTTTNRVISNERVIQTTTNKVINITNRASDNPALRRDINQNKTDIVNLKQEQIKMNEQQFTWLQQQQQEVLKRAEEQENREGKMLSDLTKLLAVGSTLLLNSKGGGGGSCRYQDNSTTINQHTTNTSVASTSAITSLVTPVGNDVSWLRNIVQTQWVNGYYQWYSNTLRPGFEHWYNNIKSGVDRALQVLNIAIALHNAAMLSSNVTQSLTYLVDSVLQNFGMQWQTKDGVNLSFSQVISSTFNNFMSSVLGSETWIGLRVEMKKLNHIYRSASQVIWNLRSMFDTVQDTANLIMDNTGKLGNAIKEAGLVFRDAFPRMPERSQTKTALEQRLDKVVDNLQIIQEMIEVLTEISENALEIQENITELKDSTTLFEKSITDYQDEAKTQEEADRLASQSVSISEIDLVKRPPNE